MKRFNALSASLDPFAGRQFYPLEIGVFSYCASWIVFSAKLDELGGHLRTLAAD